MGYRIREWHERYDVNNHGHAWKQGDELRRSPLEFIRSRVYGRSLPQGYRKLNRIAGRDAPTVFGVFMKLLEISADNTPDLRGFLCDTRGRGLSSEEIADILDWPRDVVAKCLEFLCHVDLRWIEVATGPELAIVRKPKAERENAGHSGNSGRAGNAGDSPSIQSNSNQGNTRSIPRRTADAVDIDESCPLEGFPRLQRLYPGIREHLVIAHPHAKLPRPDSRKEREERKTLARLVEIDHYSEGEVIHALRWILKAESTQADFWRGNCRSIGALRKVSDGATKFTKIFDAMTRDPEWPPVPEETPASGDGEGAE